MSGFHEHTTTGRASQSSPNTILAVLVVGTFLAPLDSSIVNIALPSIAGQFGERIASVSWVSAGYLLTSAVLLLSMGRLGDLWGLRKLYTWGLVVFGAGSLVCALSPSLHWLVAARVFQAVGASTLFAAGPALVARNFPPERRGWALGYIALAVSAGLTVGPSLGGLLVGTFGWPSIFLINVPLSLGVAVLAWRLLPVEEPRAEQFDAGGAVLAGLTLLLLLMGLGEAERVGVTSPVVWAPVLASVASGAAFVWWERRASQPMIDLRLFASSAISSGVAAATLAYMALFSVTFTMPFYLLRVKGLDARAAGLVLTVTPLAMAVFAPAAGRFSDRRGSRLISTMGLGVLTAGLLGSSTLVPSSPLWGVAVVLGLIGSGMALFQTPNTASVLRATPRARVGVGSALIAEARNVGMAIGIALTAAIVGSALGGAGLPSGSGALDAATAATLVGGMSAAYKTAAGITLVAAAIAWVGSDRPVPGESPEQ